MKKIFKWTRLWKYIQTTYSIDNKKNNLYYIILRVVVNKKFYHNVKNMIVVFDVWKKIVKICKFKKFNAFIIIYNKFEFFKIVNYIIINAYDIQFRNIINEFIIYLFNSKMNKNLFIYKYFASFSKIVRFFINRWISKHKFFDNNKNNKFKNFLLNVIYAYEI